MKLANCVKIKTLQRFNILRHEYEEHFSIHRKKLSQPPPLQNKNKTVTLI